MLNKWFCLFISPLFYNGIYWLYLTFRNKEVKVVQTHMIGHHTCFGHVMSHNNEGHMITPTSTLLHKNY